MKKTVALVCVFVMIISMFGLSSCGKKGDPIVWDNLILGKNIPEFEDAKGNVVSNDKDKLWFEIYNVSAEDCKDYISKCMESGYKTDAELDNDSYKAYNAEGYYLDIDFRASLSEMRIELSAPVELSKITWPKNGIGAKLPIPPSDMGNVEYDSEDRYRVVVGNMTPDDFKSYVETCKSKGFTVDYMNGDDYYYAYNSEGDYLTVKYAGFNSVSIEIKAKEEETTAAKETTAAIVTEAPDTQEPVVTEEQKQETHEGVSDDFKATMDSYEAFFDEYIEFIKKYNDNPTSLELLAEFTDYMTKYSDMMSKMSALEDKDLSEADMAYYIEVTARINQKLLEVQ